VTCVILSELFGILIIKSILSFLTCQVCVTYSVYTFPARFRANENLEQC